MSIEDHLHLLPARSLDRALLRHLCRLASQSSSDLQMRQRNCRDGRDYNSSFDGSNRRSMVARGCGVIRVALGLPWFCSFFLGFCRYDSVNEFDSPSVKTHLMTMVPRIPAQEARHRLVWPLTQCRQQGGMGWLHFVLISPE